MFEIWETGDPARLVSAAATLKGALDKVDTMCRLRHDQAAADIGHTQEEYRFEIRGAEGGTLAFLDYRPDPTRPYQSVIVEELLQHDNP
jgi:hypothetical protein